jgi:P-type E1-E2 ATPase
VAITLTIPGRPTLELRYLLLDVNGTLTDRGTLLPGVAIGIETLRRRLDIRLLTADTYGTAEQLAATLDVPVHQVTSGQDKAACVQHLRGPWCAAIGNGANDEAMLRSVALGIAVLGPEGASPRTLAAADVVCGSIQQALRLLAEPTALTATLRP